MANRRSTAVFLLGFALGCAASTSSGGPHPDGGPNPDGGVAPDGGGGGGDGGLPLEQACSVLNQKRCDYLQHCGLIAPGPTDDCVGYLQATWCNDALWPARVRIGTLAYDANGAQQCALDFAAAPCASFDQTPASCSAFLSPVVPLQGACYGEPYTECRQGVCRGPSTACPRSCQLPGDAGDDCEEDSDCTSDAGLYCHFGGVAQISQCTPQGVAGTPCDPTTQCAPGMFCNGLACQALRSLGQSCLIAPACDSSTWCLGVGTDAGHCVPRLDAGAACSDGAQCPVDYLCLNETGTCEPELLSFQSPCFREQACPSGATCVGVQGGDAGICETPLLQSSPCGSTLDCEADLTCSVDGGICDVRRADGSPCMLDRDCWLGSACSQYRCAREPRPGEACTSGLDCWYGECAKDGGATCIGFAPAGAPCSRDLDCASNRCVQACLPSCGP